MQKKMRVLEYIFIVQENTLDSLAFRGTVSQPRKQTWQGLLNTKVKIDLK